MEKNKLNLNEALILLVPYNNSVLSSAMRRAVRPFIKAIQTSLATQDEKYKEITNKIIGDKKKEDLTQEESKKLSDEVLAEISKNNVNIYPEINYEATSTKMFVSQVWTTFEWDPSRFADYLGVVDLVDQKLCEIYPELNVNVDEKEEESPKEEPKKKSKK